ncbi:MAG: hypothetical protein MJZ20_09040 [Bacteroidaceae bacterium]|nr:hypothetical protein [Bacteroidaceae bacterium]
MVQTDKMLQAILCNEKLVEYGEYDPSQFTNLSQALCSDNFVVNAVAQIVSSVHDGESVKEVYNKVSQYLQNHV